MPSLYDFPDVYDAVMRASTDQIETEASVIDAHLKERGIKNGRILEIASGTSPHGLMLAQQGHDVVGIDLSRPMVTYARNAARATGASARYVQADLFNFSLKATPFDCAIFMAETFTLITEYPDIANHFNVLRRHLKTGGFYLIDIDAQQAGYRNASDIWGRHTVVLPGGHAEVWYETHPADWVHGLNRLTMHCRIQTTSCKATTADHWHIRLYNPWTLSLLIKTLSGWALQGFFSYHDRSPNIAQDNNYYMVVSAV